MQKVYGIILLLLIITSFSLPISLNYKGYIEGSLLSSETLFDETPYILISSRASLYTRIKLTDFLKFTTKTVFIEEINLDRRAGVFDESGGFISEGGEGNFLDLEKEWITDDQLSKTELTLSRLNLELDLYPVEVIVGRQRLDWGVGFIFRPLDIFNPSEGISIRRGEMGFSDALTGRVHIGDTALCEVSFLPYRDKSVSESDLVGKVGFTVASYDINLHYGYLGGDMLAGVSWTGHLFDGELYGEFVHRGFEDETEDYYRILAGYTYRFGWGISATFEYFYNAAGEFDKADYDWTSFFRDDFLGLARDYTAGVITYEPTPLMTVEFDAIVNADDGSRVYGLSSKFSTSDETNFIAGFWGVGGGPDTEFSIYPSFLTYMQFRWYF